MTKPSAPRYPRIIAHRCGGALAPENTLPGLNFAARLGCHGVEYDVMLSCDGIPMVIHDETLERTTNGQGRVSQLSGAELYALDAGHHHHKSFAETRIPTLDKVLEKCLELDLWANIEIKPAIDYDTATGATVAKRLATGWSGNGVISSFSTTALRSFRATAPQLPVAILFEHLPADWDVLATELGAVAIHLSAAGITAEVAHRLTGWIWACYTVNSRAQAERLFDLGCTSIFTDRPDLWQAAEM